MGFRVKGLGFRVWGFNVLPLVSQESKNGKEMVNQLLGIEKAAQFLGPRTAKRFGRSRALGNLDPNLNLVNPKP